MNTFNLHILAADKSFYNGECVSLVFPTIDGQYGIMAHHKNMVAAVNIGELRFTKPDGATEIAAVSNGIIRVEDNDVLVLVNTAERPEEIDYIRAKAGADKAREALIQKKSTREYHNAQIKLARELNRQKIKRNYDNSFLK